MKRRDFFEKSGCGLATILFAQLGLDFCKKAEEPEAAPQTAAQEAPLEEMSRRDLIKKMLVEKKGMTAEEAEAMMVELEAKLPLVKEMCVCKNCPSYVGDETEVGFCHPLVGKSKIITVEKGCSCPTCPVYKDMSLKNGYYCTRKSELEQEMAKME